MPGNEATAPAERLAVAEARQRVLSGVAPLAPRSVPLLDAVGYVLTEEIVSPIDLPLWKNSGMDGYAVRAEDVAGARAGAPRELRVIEDVAAGAFPTRSLEPGTATRVMTGAPVPEGADSVIRVEHTDGGSGLGTAGARVGILDDADSGRNVRPRGQDLRKGSIVLEKGRVLNAAAIGVAASVGRSHLEVVRRPTVGILTSGDELVSVDGFAETLAGRRIVSSNSYALAARIAGCGMEPRILGIARDTPESVIEHLHRARGCDALVTSAGLSVGEHDYMLAALGSLGLRRSFWRVRMRPGSPFAFGWIDELGGIPWFGLPGNPVSSLVTFEIFVRPALLRMAGRVAVFAPTREVRLSDAPEQQSALTQFLRVRLGGEDGSAASLTGAQGSGLLTSMANADALVVVPEGDGPASPGFTAIVIDGSPLRSEPGY